MHKKLWNQMRKIEKKWCRERENYFHDYIWKQFEEAILSRGENYYKSSAGISSSSLSTSSTGFYRAWQNVVGSSQVEGLDGDVRTITSRMCCNNNSRYRLQKNRMAWKSRVRRSIKTRLFLSRIFTLVEYRYMSCAGVVMRDNDIVENITWYSTGSESRGWM